MEICWSDGVGPLSADWVTYYDPEQGLIREVMNDQVRHETNLRAGLIDQLTREAVVMELERLGYTVISPGAQS